MENTMIKEIDNKNDIDDMYLVEKALAKEDVIDEPENIVMEDFEESTLDDYEEFDTRAWNKGNGLQMKKFKNVTDKLEGLEAGMYLLAGESNSGKTGIMNNLIKDLADNEEDEVFSLAFSLDDTKHEVIPRIIAMEQAIPISAASKPNRYQTQLEDCTNDNAILYDQYLEKRQIGLDKLKAERDRFKIVDANKIKTSTDIRNYIAMILTYLKSKNPNIKLVVSIDAINDIKLDEKVFGRLSDSNKIMEEKAKFVKDLTVEFDIPIFCSTHLRKLNGNRRPTLDDLKEANTLVYEASVVWLVFNDVSKNKGAAKISWEDPDADEKLGAVIELDWAKNKKSSYKGRTFYLFQPYYSRCKECNKDANSRFEALIYQ